MTRLCDALAHLIVAAVFGPIDRTVCAFHRALALGS